ncbi:MAG: CDP-diacylglycerol--serine O-phosphatidyltransferase [Gammaproteobacteria bacterium]|nr:CDP-diacylglycerol--serine O-phosphatidyltransferase [Gammaproteobacteria bacterium]
MNEPKKPREGLKKGIYLLPNLFTTAALFAGFYAIISAMNGLFEQAAIAVFIAMLLDGLDGRVARMTNTSSAFGAEYDSLSDMVSFGIAPALVIYQWSLSSLATDGLLWGRIGWLVTFIYTASAAIRLARFNTQVGSSDKRFFQGLASPAAAAVLMGLVWVFESLGYSGKDYAYLTLVLTLFSGLLMVSKFSYYSFKDFDLRKKVPFVSLLAIIIIFVFLTLDPPSVLFAIFVAYMFHGPFLSLGRRIKRSKRSQSNLD